jgi:hypothetical protein
MFLIGDNITTRRVRETTVAVGKQEELYLCVCVCAAVVIQHAKSMRRIIVIFGLSGSTVFFPHYLTNGTIFLKVITEHETCVLIFSTCFV